MKRTAKKKGYISSSVSTRLFGTSMEKKFIPADKTLTAKPNKVALIKKALRSPNLLGNSVDISKFPMNGIIHILDMDLDSYGKWVPQNLNPKYNPNHISWLYFITVNGWIVKIGETGIHLYNPNKGSTSKYRINRYIAYKEGHDSDAFVRSMLVETAINPTSTISFWAVPLPKAQTLITIGKFQSQHAVINKEAERQALETFIDLAKDLPLLNRNKK